MFYHLASDLLICPFTGCIMVYLDRLSVRPSSTCRTLTQKCFNQYAWNFGELCISIDVSSLFLCPTYDSRGALCFLVCASVRPSVRSFVRSFVRLSRFRLKFLVKVVFDEVEVQSTWNLVYMCPMIWSF